MPEARPPIPAPIQREVRQRCAFGCVVCGCPLYEYHHMVPYSDTKKHVAEELTLLCDKHHKEVTNSLMTAEQVAAANASPHNVRAGVSSPFALNFQGDEVTCVIGGNRFSVAVCDSSQLSAMIPIAIDDVDLISFVIDPDAGLLLYAQIFDECNLPLLMIFENVLLYRTETWDIDFRGNTLTVREAARKIFFEISFEPPSQITISRARLLCNGVEILVRKEHVFVVNSRTVLKGNTYLGGPIGLQVGRNLRRLGAGVAVNPTAVSRYLLPQKEVREREANATKELDDSDSVWARYGFDETLSE